MWARAEVTYGSKCRMNTRQVDIRCKSGCYALNLHITTYIKQGMVSIHHSELYLTYIGPNRNTLFWLMRNGINDEPTNRKLASTCNIPDESTRQGSSRRFKYEIVISLQLINSRRCGRLWFKLRETNSSHQTATCPSIVPLLPGTVECMREKRHRKKFADKLEMERWNPCLLSHVS